VARAGKPEPLFLCIEPDVDYRAQGGAGFDRSAGNLPRSVRFGEPIQPRADVLRDVRHDSSLLWFGFVGGHGLYVPELRM
jgi:hypothetical protein